jgi:hypothetical protein
MPSELKALYAYLDRNFTGVAEAVRAAMKLRGFTPPEKASFVMTTNLEHDCSTCRFAQWNRTANGKLHPSGNGKCLWARPDIKIPICMYYIYPPALSGGAINRHNLELCPAWEPPHEPV